MAIEQDGYKFTPTDEPLLMNLYTVTVNNIRMCIKLANLGPKLVYSVGRHFNDIKAHPYFVLNECYMTLLDHLG